MTDDFRRRLDRVEQLVGVLDGCPDPRAREAARELVRTLLDLHAAGLAKVLELGGAGGGLADRLADDALVSGLLLLHNLHPHPAERRVARALAGVRPRFRSRGDVEVVAVTEERVRLRLRGDPGSAAALRAAAEEAVTEAVPDATAVEFEEAWDPALAGRVPLPLTNGVPSRAGSPP